MKKVKSEEIAAVGNRIKQLRQHLQIPQNEMAKKIGITGPHLSEIEKGKSSLSIEVVLKIIKTFNMNPEYIFLGKGEMIYDSKKKSTRNNFTFDHAITSAEKLIWMLKQSEFFAILVMGAATKIMLQENDFIMQTISKDIKTES